MKMKKITVPDIARMKAAGEKIPVLTAYDYTMARILDTAGVPVLMVGDSAGMVAAGYDTTLPVTMDEMVYHTRSVARGAASALVVSDMPFASYQVDPVEARKNAARLIKEGRAEAVKIEGGRRVVDVVKAIVEMDIPVMGHIGLTPQSIHRMGGYVVQGRSKTGAKELLDDARALEKAGVFSIVLEGVPAGLARKITSSLKIPTIGIGAGPHTDGQVLVVNDMLGLTTWEHLPKFVKRYNDLKDIIQKAVKEYIKDVKGGKFPKKEHSY
ncbi:MAG TPA: 3-methyl-2-oxobutanoate hydroxymethyltransferase [Thermodesulfobacteriota bacterium]|nr:3-methyl-2-oxobutanoate hydroxymethyltransferase [Thermodesulfobacteriota bacterium]